MDVERSAGRRSVLVLRAQRGGIPARPQGHALRYKRYCDEQNRQEITQLPLPARVRRRLPSDDPASLRRSSHLTHAHRQMSQYTPEVAVHPISRGMATRGDRARSSATSGLQDTSTPPRVNDAHDERPGSAALLFGNTVETLAFIHRLLPATGRARLCRSTHGASAMSATMTINSELRARPQQRDVSGLRAGGSRRAIDSSYTWRDLLRYRM